MARWHKDEAGASCLSPTAYFDLFCSVNSGSEANEANRGRGADLPIPPPDRGNTETADLVTTPSSNKSGTLRYDWP